MKKEGGVSGLEAAIVMIAFVVVAAVLSYVVLGAGFFVTDKAEQTVHEGTKTASTSVYQEGGFYGTLNQGTGQLDTLSFTIYAPDEGYNVDLTEMIISYTQSDISNPKDYIWSGSAPDSTHFYAGGLDILNEGQNVKINLADLQGPLGGGWFAVEIRPKIGATLFIKRWLSAGYQGGLIL